MILSAADITEMQATAVASFMDTCKLAAPTGGDWGSDPGALSFDFDSAEETACGFEPTRSGEATDGTQAPLQDAVLRLAIGTTIDETYRVQVTERHAVALDTPETYAIIGVPRRGPSALVCDLKLLSGGSVH